MTGVQTCALPISVESGLDPDKWDNDAGLTLPTDMTGGNPGFGYLTPPSMPDYIVERRNQAFQERQIIARFSDQQSGVKQAGVDTATEALALQQGANSGVNHKKMLLEETLSDMFEYILDLCMEYWDQEMAFAITEDENSFLFFRPSDLKEVPVLIPSTEGYQRNFMRQLEFMGLRPEQAPPYMPLMGDDGQPVTKKVALDITVTVGAGLPQNKAFIYSVIKESAGLLQPQTLLRLLRDYVGLPVTDEDIMPQPQQMPNMTDTSMQDALVQGLTPQGNPQMPRIGGVA